MFFQESFNFFKKSLISHDNRRKSSNFNKVKVKLNINEIQTKIDFNIIEVYYVYQVEWRIFMNIDNIPDWLTELEIEELEFIKLFVLTSGSLKELAKHYQITYPTIRLRLDRLIQKIKISEEQKPNTMVDLIKELTLQDKLDLDTAKQLMETYKNEGK